jgi:hypothetical protein
MVKDMISYEELCEALAGWRTRNGMANGPSAQPTPGLSPSPSPSRAPSPSLWPEPGARSVTDRDAFGRTTGKERAIDAGAPPAAVPNAAEGGESSEIPIDDGLDVIDEEPL